MSSLLLKRIVSSTASNFSKLSRHLLGIQDVCTTQRVSMKVKSMLKLRCPYCYFIRIDGRLYVKCHKRPRHAAMEPFNVKILW